MKSVKIEGAFFYLLKAGLWGKAEKPENFFPLMESEWSVLFQLAREQTVEGTLFDGLQLLAEEYLPSRAIRIKCMFILDKLERQNQNQVKQIAQQYAFFKSIGLKPILLKGQSVAVHYALPMHRMSGDIDWCLEDSAQFNKLRNCLTKMGMAVTTLNSQPSYQWKGAELDLHDQLFDVYSPGSRKVLECARKAFPDTTLRLCDQDVTVLSPLIQVMQVTLHILKHSLAFGIGLRQFCDLACLYQQFGPNLDGAKLHQIYKELGILTWITAVHQLLIEYIGLDPSKLPFSIQSPISAKPILEDILSSGNFGFHDKVYNETKNGEFSLRKSRSRQVFWRLIKYYRYAPKETFWFPLVHFIRRHSK